MQQLRDFHHIGHVRGSAMNASWYFSSGCRNFMIVVYFGDCGAERRASWRIEMISYGASSMTGLLSENQLCSRWMRNIVSMDRVYDCHLP